MKLVADGGLWTTGPRMPLPPSVAVLEVAGAVLEWDIGDQPAGRADGVRITFTNIADADWLWRVTGVAGHAALVDAVTTTPAHDGQVLDIADVVLTPEPLTALRRAALGHWLRRWWPASRRDGIGSLDGALLDAELAVLTADLQEYFSSDTVDSDVVGLLARHRGALADAARGGDPRILELVRSVVALAADCGMGDWSDILVSQDFSLTGQRDDYALAAGGPSSGDTDVVARGVSTVCWTAVPPGIFDAADDTVDWAVRTVPTGSVVQIRVATVGPADGVAVRVDSGAISGQGHLDVDGRATVDLVDTAGAAVTESLSWAHHWAATTVAVGAGAGESESVRQSIRTLARRRISSPGADSFLAEILAAEADY